MSDKNRHHLVTTFVCTECGNSLQLSYSVPHENASDPNVSSDGIVGADKMHARIAIHPCTKCYGDAIRPLKALREAMASLQPTKMETIL